MFERLAVVNFALTAHVEHFFPDPFPPMRMRSRIRPGARTVDS